MIQTFKNKLHNVKGGQNKPPEKYYSRIHDFFFHPIYLKRMHSTHPSGIVAVGLKGSE